MLINRIVEYTFFFGLMGVVAYIIWNMIAPFVSALALATIIVTICYPLYQRVVKLTPRRNETVAALLTTVFVIIIIFIPLILVASAIVNEAVTFYNDTSLDNAHLLTYMTNVEETVARYAPGVKLNFAEYLKQATTWLAGNVGAIFAGTASTLFSFFIALIGSFYLFRDGEKFSRQLLSLSPLPDDQDALILKRLALAVRSVATGTLMVALLQGLLTGFGLWLFGFDKVVLWGTIAAIGALIPGVGTSLVFIPSVIYLVVIGHSLPAIGLAIWGMLAVGLIDNFLGPYLMSRGAVLHPFIVLIAVLGGISVFGPIGFVVGPVLVSLLKVLFELYSVHISDLHRTQVIE